MKNKTIQLKSKEIKQVEVTEEHGKLLLKSNAFPEKEKSMWLYKQKEMFYNIAAERTEEIEKLHNSVIFQNWICYFKGPTKNIDFNNFLLILKLFLMI